MAWLRHGISTSLLANINRRKGAAPFKAEDFMLEDPAKAQRKSRKQTPEEMKAILLPIADSLRKQGKIRKRRADGGQG
jgi:hypothetical protein